MFYYQYCLAPPYRGLHFVSPAGWNYPSTVDPNVERAVNFAQGPPTFEQATVSTNKYDNIPQSDEPNLFIDSPTPRRIRYFYFILTHHTYSLFLKYHVFSKHSLAEPEFIDDDSPTVEMNPMPRGSFDKFKQLPPTQERRRSSQQRFTQMLVGTAQAILLRNRATTKRLRDSLRIHRQR